VPTAPGLVRSGIDPGKLQLALSVAIGREGTNQNQVCDATGVRASALSEFMNHGTGLSANDILALLLWLNIKPAQLLLPEAAAAIGVTAA
jgi:transcriptional regulator with XRE-family HTH domain